MPVLVGATSFTTSDTFTGVLPEVPAVATSSCADRDRLLTLLAAERSDPMKNDGKLDTYWQGKGLGRAARIAEIADHVGDTPRRATPRSTRSAARSPSGSPPLPASPSGCSATTPPGAR